MYLTTRGLVLRTTEYKETDRILTVLSADHGLLTMKARGVRSNRSKLKGACQLLTYAEFTVGEAHGFSSITEATAIEMFPELRTDIVLLSLASYFAQLAEVLSQEDAASPALLPLILQFYNLSAETLHYAAVLIIMHNVFAFALHPTSFNLANSLRAAGDAGYTMFVGVGSMLIFRLGAAFLFGIVLNMGIIGIWIAMGMDWLARSSGDTKAENGGK